MANKPVDIFWGLMEPPILLLLAASYVPRTILNLVLTGQFRAFISPTLFKEAWFAIFWGVMGPSSSKGATPRVGPLMAQAFGVVLDIGPGSGEWLQLFDKEKVTKIYGVEPNGDYHPALRRKIKQAGLEDIYVICPVGVEDLGEKWVSKGEVDSVVTIHCLCSVPEPKRMIGELYSYLKDGGVWIVYEHVITHVGGFIGAYQAAVDVIWPHFLGGCSIRRNTEKWMKEAGSWSKFDVKAREDVFWYHILPHIMGVAKK